MINWFNHRYPYTNFHELNLDWVIDEMKILSNKVNLKYDEVLSNFIMEKFNNLFANIAYNEEDHALVLNIIQSAGDGHLYDPVNENMTII